MRGASGVTGSSPMCSSIEIRRLPELLHVHPGVEAEPGERLGEALPGDAVQRERDGIDGGRDQVGAGARGLERDGERVAAGALAVDADRQTARLVQPRDELVRAVRLERSRRVVEEHARDAELAQLRRLLDERLRLAGRAGAVDEPGRELGARVCDRLGRLAQVRDVVERVVEAKDLDPVLRGRRDEAPHEIGVDRVRADEEAAAQRHRERRLEARAQRADPLPRALDAAPDGRVEDASSRHLEVAEAGRVQDLGDAEQLGRRNPLRERILPEQPDGRVDERGHAGTLQPDPFAHDPRLETDFGRELDVHAEHFLETLRAERRVTQWHERLAELVRRRRPLHYRERHMRQKRRAGIERTERRGVNLRDDSRVEAGHVRVLEVDGRLESLDDGFADGYVQEVVRNDVEKVEPLERALHAQRGPLHLWRRRDEPDLSGERTACELVVEALERLLPREEVSPCLVERLEVASHAVRG